MAFIKIDVDGRKAKTQSDVSCSEDIRVIGVCTVAWMINMLRGVNVSDDVIRRCITECVASGWEQVDGSEVKTDD